MADDYREGDDSNEGVDPQADTEKDPSKAVDTAFMVIRFADGHLEAAITIPGMDMARKATPQDIRNNCDALSNDVQATITANMSSQAMAASLTQAMANKADHDMRKQVNKSGIVIPGRG